MVMFWMRGTRSWNRLFAAFCLLLLHYRLPVQSSDSSPFNSHSTITGGEGVSTLGARSGQAEALTYKTGTTIVGICCRDGVVLGADTRTTAGPNVIDKEKAKVRSLAQHIFCCAAGTSADCDQLTRRVRLEMARQRVEYDLSGEYDRFNTVASAVRAFLQSLWSKGRRKASAVFLIGGVDEVVGNSLYLLDGEAFPVRIPFGSLGSGSVDALPVLETACRSLVRSDEAMVELSVDEATDIVRRAVRAGILNDLGSGSHVDLCVISNGSDVRLWRERLVASGHEDRPSPPAAPVNASYASPGPDETTPDESAMGRKVWSRFATVRRLVRGEVVERTEALDPKHHFVDTQKL